MSDIDDIFKKDDLKEIPIGKCRDIPVELKNETIHVIACHTDDNEWELEGKGIKGKLNFKI